VTDSSRGVLIWDFDGTLAQRPGRWSGAVLDALTEVAGPHPYGRADIIAVIQGGYPWHEPEVPHPQLSDPATWWDHLTAVLATALRRLGVPDAVAQSAATAVRGHYTCPASWQAYRDARPALDRLTELGWRHVLLSNHVPELEEIIESVGLGGRFAAVVNSAVTGYEKPHPRAFALALAAAGQPRVAWMIGDNPVADIAGAARAGLPGILVRTRPADPEVPHVAGLDDLPALLPAGPA